MPTERPLPSGTEIAEMHRILHKVVERERLTAVELEFLRTLRIDALESFTDV